MYFIRGLLAIDFIQQFPKFSIDFGQRRSADIELETTETERICFIPRNDSDQNFFPVYCHLLHLYTQFLQSFQQVPENFQLLYFT